MKKLLVIFLLLCVRPAVAQKIFDKPNPPQAVNDFGNFLEPFQREALEKKIRDYNDSTSSAIVIITVPDLEGYDIAEVAFKYMREWKPGVADKDNGVIILVAKEERKARTIPICLNKSTKTFSVFILNFGFSTFEGIGIFENVWK